MDSIAIKLFSSVDGDVRRTRLDTGADFNALAKQASAAFGVDGDIKWKDEDGDLVNVKCDGDWRECVNYNGGGAAIKLHFFPRTSDGPPDRQQMQQQQQHSEPFEIEVISSLPMTPEEQVLPDDSEFILAERVTEELAVANEFSSEPAGDTTATATATATAIATASATITNITNTDTGTAAATAAAEEPRKERTPLPLRTSAEVATEEPAKRQPVHHGVECDASGTNPIVGIRYHLIHYNYDVNADEFAKLPAEHKALYEAIAHPGAKPVPFKTSTFPLVKDMIRTHRAAREELHRQQEEKDAKEAQRPIFAFISPGDVIPPHEAAFGSVGPGVAQLQHALIAVGAMSPSAIRYRAGYFGPHTTEAIRSYKENHGIASTDNEFGTYNEAVRTQLLDEIDTLVNGQDQDQVQDQAGANQPSKADTATSATAQGQNHSAVEATAPTNAPADATANGVDAGAGACSKWAGELEKLASMGFADATENTRLLDLHDGALPFVIAGLL